MTNSNQNTRENLWLTRLFPALIVAAAVAAGLWRIHFGLEVMDEGYYLSPPLRYVLGDMPFRDEIETPLRCFDIVLWPLMKTLPGHGNVLLFRYIGFLFHCAGIGALLYSLRKYMPTYVRAALFAATVHINVLTIWSPGYNLMSADFIFFSLAAWFIGMQSASRLAAVFLGFAAGLSLFLAFACYATITPLLIVPVAILIYCIFGGDRRGPIVYSSAGFIVAAAAACLATAAIFAATWLLPAWRVAFTDFTSFSSYKIDLFARFKHTVRMAFPSLPFLATHFLCWTGTAVLFARKRAGRIPRSTAIAGTMALVAVYIASQLVPVARMANDPNYLWPLTNNCVGLAITAGIFFLVFRPRPAKTKGAFPYICAALFLVGGAWYFITGASSTMGLIGVSHTVTPLLILIAALSLNMPAPARKTKSENTPGMSKHSLVVTALCLVFAANTATTCLTHTFSDNLVKKLRTPFKSEKLKGIYSTPGRVRDIDNVIAYLAPRVKEGDYFLAFDEIPIFYYITGTRPAIDHIDSPKYAWPVAIRRQSVRRMIERGRIPRYAVRHLVDATCLGNPGCKNALTYSTNPEIDPLFSFVSGNYALVKKFGQYDIWRLKDKNQSEKQAVNYGKY